jgi:8-oxo-dGTP diphosphatase
MKTSHETFDIGVKALIVHDKHLLLLKRRDHDVWEMPGGRVDKGEDILETLQRELTEELPQLADCVIGKLVHAQPTEFTLPGGNRLMLLFYAVAATLPSKIVLREEHEGSRWVSLHEISTMPLQPQVRQAALLALAR